MNIFEILSAGNRVLKEEHISAVLAWMLDPYHDHGLGMELLKRVVQAYFAPEAEISKTLKAGEFSGLVMRDRSRLSIHTQLEVVVDYEDRQRSIDILITINDNIILAIENKTSRGSIQENQLKEEVDGLAEKFNIRNNHKLYFVFLTPSGVGPTAIKALGRISRDKCIAEPVHILWKCDENEKQEKRPSISKILNEILRDESVGKTSPLSSETKFLIKSFIRFIENDFSYFKGKLLEADLYYEGLADGLEAVQNLFTVDDTVFIGFKGGVSALAERLELAKDDEGKQKELKDRQYKWSKDDKTNGKKRANWLPIKLFIEMVDKNIF